MSERYSPEELYRMGDTLRDEAIRMWTMELPPTVTENNATMVIAVSEAIQARTGLARLLNLSASSIKRREQLAREGQRTMAQALGAPRPTP
jgi:hypothetical protein